MGYISFELNCKYYLYISYKEVVDLHFKSKAADELTKEPNNLIAV